MRSRNRPVSGFIRSTITPSSAVDAPPDSANTGTAIVRSRRAGLSSLRSIREILVRATARAVPGCSASGSATAVDRASTRPPTSKITMLE